PAWTNYRISMGVDLQRATAVELQFGLGATEADPPRLVLRASAQGVVLGKRNGETASFQALSATRPFPQPAGEDGPVYHELRVELHETFWWAYFRGQPVGAAPAGVELNEFLLVTEGGSALFDTLEAAELVQPGS